MFLGYKQVDIARELKLAECTVSRLMRKPAVMEALNAWSNIAFKAMAGLRFQFPPGLPHMDLLKDLENEMKKKDCDKTIVNSLLFQVSDAYQKVKQRRRIRKQVTSKIPTAQRRTGAEMAKIELDQIAKEKK